jgi:hypothetical protein
MGAEIAVLRSPADSEPDNAPSSTGRSPTMLWTILIILVIVALALFILSRVRGGRRGL